MMSGKQRRMEIMAKRHARIKIYASVDTGVLPQPPGAVAADRERLGHNNTYGLLPLFYIDRAFICRDCGADQIWTAKQQKWWYENAQGNINSTAVRCRTCRKQQQAKRAEARRIHLEGLERKHKE